jgi:protein-tyrosine phosphatase
MTLSVKDARLANVSTGAYLSRTFNIDPPERRIMPGVPSYKDAGERMRLGMDCDEVYPGVIIGTGQTVKNLKYLVKLGVTHVLNTAENDVNLSPQRYAKEGISYKGFRLADLPQADIYQHFDDCAEFIDRALSFSHSLVFVNCLLGASRSATIVAAYLMKKKRMSATQALSIMRQCREVRPNIGFLQQLGQLDDELRKERYRRL